MSRITAPPSQKTRPIRPWMNASGEPSEARPAPWSTPHGRDESLRVRTYCMGRARGVLPTVETIASE